MPSPDAFLWEERTATLGRAPTWHRGGGGIPVRALLIGPKRPLLLPAPSPRKKTYSCSSLFASLSGKAQRRGKAPPPKLRGRSATQKGSHRASASLRVAGLRVPIAFTQCAVAQVEPSAGPGVAGRTVLRERRQEVGVGASSLASRSRRSAQPVSSPGKKGPGILAGSGIPPLPKPGAG